MPGSQKSNRIGRASGAVATLIAALVGALLLALWARPPELLRVGASYAAKMVCSNVYLAGRDAAEVLRDDVQAPGSALLRLMRVTVDPVHGLVRAGLLGFIGDGLAAVRSDRSCMTIPGGSLAGVFGLDPLHPPRLAPAAPHAGHERRRQGTGARAAEAGDDWPDGDAVHTEPELDRLIADDALTGPETRAVVVVHRGRIVAERYGRGFDARMPQLGWSMAKTVTAALVGTLIQQGRLALDTSVLWPPRDARGDQDARPSGNVERARMERSLRRRIRRYADAVPRARHMPLFPMFVVFFISGLAETNRSPFDLVEGESELVAGYFVEYSGDGLRALLSRRIRQHDPGQRDDQHPVPRRLAGAVRRRALHLGLRARSGSRSRSRFVLFCFLWVRATFPRFRYDQLMRLGWKVFLPLSLFWLVLTAGVLVATGWVPH